MKHARIFEVDYNYQQTFNGKKDSQWLRDRKSIVAKDALEAGQLVKTKVMNQTSSFKDEENKNKLVKVTTISIDITSINLIAEA
jgi:hypothetical protein